MSESNTPEFRLYKPSELRQWLEEEGLGPKRSLSQNFLIDGNIVNKIVHSLELSPGQLVVEIGPGPGVLTQNLLAKSCEVIAIEADRKLAERLTRLGKLQVIAGDALSFDWQGLFCSLQEKIQQGHGPIRLVSNLPYHLSSEIFFQLLPLGSHIDRLVIMVQKEFADRLQSKLGQKGYGPLSILREYCSNAQSSFKVPASCFFPRPNVESTVVRLDLLPIDALVAKKLQALLKQGFKYRRKTLSHALYELPLTQESLEQLSPYTKKRAEELSLKQWLEILDICGPFIT